MLSNKGNLQSSLNTSWQAGQITRYINYDHFTKRLFWGPALAGDSSLRQVTPSGELRRLLGAFIYKQKKSSVHGEVPAYRMAQTGGLTGGDFY